VLGAARPEPARFSPRAGEPSPPSRVTPADAGRLDVRRSISGRHARAERPAGRAKGRCRASDGRHRRKRGFRPPAAETAHAPSSPAHKSFADRSSLYEEITKKIIAELEAGRVPWVQPWNAAPAPLGMPTNASTGRAYSGINVLILWIACLEHGFTTQNWLTFRQTLKLGGHVRKGDRFIPTASASARPRPVTNPMRSRS
jgi:hypothetical protein